MSRPAAILALLAACASLAAAPSAVAPRRGVWFCGDFETGGLQGWAWDIAREEAAVVVRSPVRRGRYAVRITLTPGDSAASKERAELKVRDKEIERFHGRQGREMWYGWSLLIPAEHADPPGKQFQILGQWHHRPGKPAPAGGGRSRVTGPPPLTVHLTSHNRRDHLMLVGHSAPKPPPLTLGIQPIRRGAWNDLVFHIRWSTGRDGFVEAWVNGRPWTQGKMYGPTLYSSVSNYLRLGLYRSPGVLTTNHVYYDEVRIGGSYQAVAP